mmetsp:Transcript_19626/g.29120  ORF Transcript_19626/g.29120 Transcript_19626/m.29120 type:complete len:99 (+) Transcript_19626:105-401(+)
MCTCKGASKRLAPINLLKHGPSRKKEVRFDARVVTHNIPQLDSFAARELFYTRQETKSFKRDLHALLILRALSFSEDEEEEYDAIPKALQKRYSVSFY